MNFFVLVIGLYLLISYVLIKLLGLISDVYKNRLVIGFYWCLNFFVLSGLFFLRFREIDNISSAVGKLFFTYISLQFMALLLSPLALLIEKILSINSNNTFDDTKRNLFKKIAIAVPTFSLGVSLYGVYNESENIKINTLKLEVEAKAKGLSDFKIIQLSDIHLGLFFSMEKLEACLKLIQAEQADLLVITGDLIDDLSLLTPTITLLEQYQQYFNNKIVISWGNHEHIRNFKLIEQAFKDSEITVLCNENYQINQKLYLLGVDYPFDNSKLNRSNMLNLAQKNIPQEALKVLLSHHPAFIEESFENNIALTLAGHTHGGQFPGFAQMISLRYKYYKGLYKKGDLYGYVNVGLGHWMPFRLGCRPEITIFILK